MWCDLPGTKRSPKTRARVVVFGERFGFLEEILVIFDMRVEGVITGDPRPICLNNRDGYTFFIQGDGEDDQFRLFVTNSAIMEQIELGRRMAFRVIPRPYLSMSYYEPFAIVPVTGNPYIWHVTGMLEPRRQPAVSVSIPCMIGGYPYHNPITIPLIIQDQNHSAFGTWCLRPGDWISLTGRHRFQKGLWMLVDQIGLAKYMPDRYEDYEVRWGDACQI